jgi:hypothetical protein
MGREIGLVRLVEIVLRQWINIRTGNDNSFRLSPGEGKAAQRSLGGSFFRRFAATRFYARSLLTWDDPETVTSREMMAADEEKKRKEVVHLEREVDDRGPGGGDDTGYETRDTTASSGRTL